MSVERAVCQLLLGDPDAAESALGLGPNSTGNPDQGVLQFVLVRVFVLIPSNSPAYAILHGEVNELVFCLGFSHW